ncbi:COG4270 Predicted membrane protein [Microbacteriaceae bacterium]
MKYISAVRHIARYLLGAALIYAGVGHFTFSRLAFQAQVPPWLPLEPDFVVLASGAVEIALGLGLIFVARYRKQIGWLTAAFFLAVFPGNISQYLTQTDAFGLNTDEARAIRLLFQPLLIIWALWATAAWSKSTQQSKKLATS